MCVRVVAGKGAADRYSVLSPTLLELLKDKNRDIREVAAEALKRIDREAAKKAGVP